MKNIGIFSVVLALVICLTKIVIGKHLFLRPMSASEVYDVLSEAGQLNAIPEGRHISQGIAAATGFALGVKIGVKKGAAGVIIFNLASSNATQEYINSIDLSEMLGAYNLTGNIEEITSGLTNSFDGLTNGFTNGLSDSLMLPTMNLRLPEINLTIPCQFNKWNISGYIFGHCNTGGSDSGSDSSGSNTAQILGPEICFTSRSLKEDEDDDDDVGGVGKFNDDIYEGIEALGRQQTLTSITTPTATSATGPTTAATIPYRSGGVINCVVINKSRRRHRRSINSKLKAVLGLK